MFSTEVIPLLIPLVFVALTLSSLFFYRRRNQKPIPLLQIQADRLGGKVLSRILGFNVYLEFERFGIRVRMRCRQGSKSSAPGGGRRPPTTVVSAEIKSPIALKLKVNDDLARAEINKALGLDNLETGNIAFEKHFHIQSNDEQFASKFMNSDMQSLMISLAEALSWPPQISLDLSELELRTNYILTDSAEFEALTDGFIALLERVNEMQLGLREAQFNNLGHPSSLRSS